ncbi:MAG: DUF533 domain-containing protein [Planctomycetaceae bacterium]
MNAIEILGGMLGRKSGGGGLGGVILDNILKGNRGGSARDSSGGRGGVAVDRHPDMPTLPDTSDGQEFDSLEDLLRHAHNKHTARTSRSARASRQREQDSRSQPEPQIVRRQTDFTAEYEGNPEPYNEQARVLVLAMINAAKADGNIDQEEQNAIVQQLGELTQDEVDFLHREFAEPLNVRDFVWSVPLGMEEQVYAVSLMAIHLDEKSEAQYLRELGHGFRMTLDDCNVIHRKFNAPLLR